MTETFQECPHTGCDRPGLYDERCNQHHFMESELYHPERKKFCAYGSCPRLKISRGLCKYHYKQFRTGVPLTPSPGSSEHTRWKMVDTPPPTC